MSIDVCNGCTAYIDTDLNPEVYREEYGNECLCDTCYDRRGETIAITYQPKSDLVTK